MHKSLESKLQKINQTTLSIIQHELTSHNKQINKTLITELLSIGVSKDDLHYLLDYVLSELNEIKKLVLLTRENAKDIFFFKSSISEVIANNEETEVSLVNLENMLQDYKALSIKEDT